MVREIRKVNQFNCYKQDSSYRKRLKEEEDADQRMVREIRKVNKFNSRQEGGSYTALYRE